MNKRNLTITRGQSFYDLTVLSDNIEYITELSGRKRRAVRCKCKCGNEKLIRIESLYDTRPTACAKSCGCTKRYVNGINAQSRRRPESVYRFLYERYLVGSKQRNIIFELSKTQFENIIKQKCYYCGQEPELKQPQRKTGDLIGIPVNYNGVDRIDSNKSYNINNCVPCCTRCNYMKSNLDIDIFLNHVNKIVEYQKQ
jgi:hypothetical protein